MKDSNKKETENQQKEIRVLLLEDNPVDAELIEFELINADLFFTMKRVDTENTFEQAIREFMPDIILSDYALPTYNGMQALSLAKKICPHVPFILVTGALTEDSAIEMFTSGAWDYVLKHRLSRLVPAVRRALAEADEHKARHRAERELQKSYALLERRVVERTAELEKARQALQEARDELEDRVIKRTNNLITEISERIRVEHEKNKLIKDLDEERSRLKAIIDSLPVGLWMTDSDGKITFVSEMAESIWGGKAPRASSIGEYGKYEAHWADTGISIVPQDMPLARALEGEIIRDQEIEIKRFDGRDGTQLVSAAPVRTSDGKISGSVAVAQDITEGKKRESRLRSDLNALTTIHELSIRTVTNGEFEQLLQDILDAAIDIMKADKGSLQLLEGDSLKILAQHGHDKSFLDFFASAEHQASSCGEAMYRAERVVVPDIEESPLFAVTPSLEILQKSGVRAMQSTPIITRNGKLLGIFSTHWNRPHIPDELDLLRIDLLARQAADLIEHYQVENALNIERKRLFNVLETIPVMVCLLNPDYKIVFANSSFRQKFGAPEERKCYEHCFGQKEPCTFYESYKVLETGQPLQWEVIAPDGSIIQAHHFPFQDTDGSPLILEMDIDITALRRTEEELRSLNQEMEKRVAERTTELENANKELESFSYSVSHDLRAPLRAIDGFSRMLLKNEHLFDEEARRRIQIIRQNAVKMDDLINDILNFSRSGRAPVSFKEIDISRLVNDVCQEQLMINPERKPELRMKDLPEAKGDPVLIRQVLFNLLANAVKFTKNREKAVIEVGGEVKGKENIYYVQDNGTGFDMKYYDKLFGVFQRLHAENEFEGTGIGLAIVQKIIHRHGGRVWAEGEVGKGATFYFSLPKKNKST